MNCETSKILIYKISRLFRNLFGSVSATHVKTFAVFPAFKIKVLFQTIVIFKLSTMWVIKS